MNIQQVKAQWTLEKLLSAMGYAPDQAKSKGHDLWYKSPFRPSENEASFHIHARHDIWKDFGLTGTSGGDLIAFVQRLLEEQGRSSSVSDALEWFKEFSGESTVTVFNRTQSAPVPQEEAFKLLSVKPIYSSALFDYLKKRGIDRAIGEKYLKQVYFLHRSSKRRIYGLGMKNRAGGFEIRNPLGFKGVIGNKMISVFKGDCENQVIDVYEGMFDFLSGVQLSLLKGQGANDSIVMHTNTLYQEAAKVITAGEYHRVRLWFDNDEAGQKGQEALMDEIAKQSNMAIEPMNQYYSNFKDVNEWQMELKRA